MNVYDLDNIYSLNLSTITVILEHKIGILPEGSISTWLLTLGKEMEMSNPEGAGLTFSYP